MYFYASVVERVEQGRGREQLIWKYRGIVVIVFLKNIIEM